jgi:hypothetical protein
MCELMGTTPKQEDIPVELDDFPEEVQGAFSIYFILQDQWEGMSGTYMGKNMTGICDIFQIYGVMPEDRKTVFEIIHLIDQERTAQIALLKSQTKQ